MQIGQAVSQWYDMYLESEYGNDIPTETEERVSFSLNLFFPTAESTPEPAFANKYIQGEYCGFL